MTVAIVGHPFAGKRTLADALTAFVPMLAIGASHVGAVIAKAPGGQARYARDFVAEGQLVPDLLFGELRAKRDQRLLTLNASVNLTHLSESARQFIVAQSLLHAPARPRS